MLFKSASAVGAVRRSLGPTTMRAMLFAVSGLAAVTIISGRSAEVAERYDLGRPATQAEIASLDIDVRPDGRGLPVGHGNAQEGQQLFAERCEGCHHAGGTKPPGQGFDVLVGRQGAFNTSKPVRTIGTYWPYATTLYDYIRRAMPFDQPRSLSPNEVYAVVAYLLSANDIVAKDATLDERTLPGIVMPFRDGYIDRDDWHTPAAHR